MKKLLFATAIAASAAAFADPINAISFEDSQYANIDYATNLTGRADIPDPGRSDTGTYFLYEANSGSSDSSVVTNVGDAFTAKGTAYFAGLMEAESFSNQKFLALDTEGGTLWRSINTIGTGALGEARTVAETGTYLDTLVQFTVTEDEAPTVGADDKLAIWLQAGESTTNLMVKAAVVEGISRTPTTFTITNATVEAGTWYRLTVKAFADITDGDGIAGFQIFLDGNLLASDTVTLAGSTLSDLSPEEFDDSHYTDIVLGKYFASLVAANTLQGVGFQGTGAVDEIVWIEEDLFPAGGDTMISFTLTGGANAAVSYVIGEGSSEDWDGTSAPISVASGATVTFTAAPESGYTYAGVTADGWTVSGDNLVCETNSTENITLAVPNAVAITYTLTVPNVANATLTSPASLTGIAPGTEVTLTWTAAEGYTFPNGSTTMTKTVTVNSDMTIDVSDVESSLKQVFTVTITDIENATIAATTNNIPLTDALSENTTTNKYTVESGDTVTVTATAAEGYEYLTAPEGWTLTEGVLSIETNVTAAVELAAPVPTLSTVTIAVPTAATGLVYDGTEKTGVVAGTGYTLSGTPAATAAGAYTATATLEQGYAWEGGLTGDQTINWSIARATVTATVSLNPASATFDSAKTTPSAYTKPSVSFDVDGVTLVENTDYTVAWSLAEVTGEGTFTYTVSPVVGSNYTFTEASATLTIMAQQTEDWVADVGTITAGTKASAQYPSLAGTAVANADAAQLTTWATGVGKVSFANAKAENGINVDAFLLNIANDSTAEQIAAEKEEFVANITINANGTPVVTTPTGKTYNGKCQLKAKVNLADTTWTPVEAASTTYKFYMYELSLPAAE